MQAVWSPQSLRSLQRVARQSTMFAFSCRGKQSLFDEEQTWQGLASASVSQFSSSPLLSASFLAPLLPLPWRAPFLGDPVVGCLVCLSRLDCSPFPLSFLLHHSLLSLLPQLIDFGQADQAKAEAPHQLDCTGLIESPWVGS